MLTKLFKTEERSRILHYVMFRSSFGVAEVSRATGITKGLVSRYLRCLMEHGLLQKEGRRYSPLDGAHSRAIKLLLNLEKTDLSALSLGSAKGLGLYGSRARGTNHQDSDLDMWLRADSLPPESELAASSSAFRFRSLCQSRAQDRGARNRNLFAVFLFALLAIPQSS